MCLRAVQWDRRGSGQIPAHDRITEEEAVAIIETVIESAHELIGVAHRVEAGRVIIPAARIRSRRRVKPHEGVAERSNAVRGNDVAGEGIPEDHPVHGASRGRIENRLITAEPEPAEIATPLFGRGHRELASAPAANARAFPTEKIEGPVFSVIYLRNQQRTAQGSSKLVVSKFRLLQSIEVREETRRVERVVAQELISGPVHLIRSRPRGDVH